MESGIIGLMNDVYTHSDALNLLCGDLIGEGIHRKVFSCRIRPDLVVKVEIEKDWRYFANMQEQKFWNDNEHYKPVADWLAPCEFLSPDARIMLQRRVEPVRASDCLPVSLPHFLTDIKRENFGYLNGKLVCCDYAVTIDRPNVKLKKCDWDD
jgi:hypothetical protein